MKFKGFFTRALAILLVCLLILVGFGNLLSDNNPSEELVAKVGKEVISLSEYKSLYQNYSNNASSSEEQKKLKYELLDAFIKHKLLLNLISELDLKVGDESVEEHIKNTKHFQDDDGKFDQNKFRQVLEKLHVTEQEYVSQLKKMIAAGMFMTSLFKDKPITFGKEIDEQIYKSRTQTRVVDIIKVGKNAVKNISEPDEQDLLSLYEKNKPNFHHPEYRTVQYISLGQKYFEDQVKISDKEVDDIIERQALKDQRDILNIVFSTKEEAEKAKKRLAEDRESFEKVISEFGKADFEDIRINNVTQDFLPENMRQEVFSLKEGEITGILTSNFGWHIIKIVSIHQISQEDLVKLKENIKSILISQKSFEEANNFMNQVNYKIYNGATIEEISNEYNLSIQTIGPIDANAQSDRDLVSFIFSRQKDQKSYFKNVGNAIVSVKIVDIIPPKLQSFEESKKSVLEFWRSKFITQKILEIGNEIADKLRNKTNIEETQGIELLKGQKILRDQENYPFSFVKEIFDMKDINSVTSPVRHGDVVIIGVLKDMYSADGKLNTFETGKRIMTSLEEQLIRYLESKYKVEVNHSVLDNI
ncbi:MAG: SurA N-terminal domain-containing protein [Wolbachia endosymbiont of Tyrophagus putrescentiae]|nr:SurA N-terminal domain-containing protein [Wolbachia endosymbiont of Tyrophagus putrescentiae]